MEAIHKSRHYGATKQINGRRCRKHDLQIVALGDLDELDSSATSLLKRRQRQHCRLQKRCKHGSGNYMSCWRILRFRAPNDHRSTCEGTRRCD